MSNRPHCLPPLVPRLSSVASTINPHSSSSNSTVSPISPPSSRILTPPPRLHLRTLLPTPPLPKARLALPPQTPMSWIWRCHLCGSSYRLGVTRRCLEDGHFFCSVPSPAPSPISPMDTYTEPLSFPVEEDGISDDQRAKEEIKRKMAEKKGTKKTRRRIPRGCLAEFDYKGWSQYNTWRREVSISEAQRKPIKPALDPQASRIIRLKHWAHLVIGDDGNAVAARPSNNREIKNKRRPKRDCWKDCDFPSECHNERKAEREWEARIRMERVRAEKEVEAKRAREMWRMQREKDFGLPELDVDPVIWGEIVYEGEEGMKVEHRESVHRRDNVHVHPETNIMELFLMDETNLGPLGTDSDGLGEAALQTPFTARRRSSVDEGMGVSPPTSPLKCSFNPEEVTIPVIANKRKDKMVEPSERVGKSRDGADIQLGEEKARRGKSFARKKSVAEESRAGR